MSWEGLGKSRGKLGSWGSGDPGIPSLCGMTAESYQYSPVILRGGGYIQPTTLCNTAQVSRQKLLHLVGGGGGYIWPTMLCNTAQVSRQKLLHLVGGGGGYIQPTMLCNTAQVSRQKLLPRWHLSMTLRCSPDQPCLQHMVHVTCVMTIRSSKYPN